MRITWLILLFFIFIPHVSLAAVTIHEVAWMGSAVSANDEWLELYNSSSEAVDITGWTLSDGMNLSITLTGTISGGAYVVLERTSDESAPGAAFLIYTGALVNTGATLALTRADGGLEDQVAGGTDWQNIGGDNTTKETAQYTSAGWITAPATPGASNHQVSSNDTSETPEDTSESQSTTESATKKKNSGNSGEPVVLIVPGVTLTLDVTAQMVAYVHQPVAFDVEPGGIGRHLSDSLVYEWNFGDGDSANGKQVTHAFAFPGTYVTTIKGEYARQTQVARHEITVLPVELSLTQNLTGDVQINNDSPYEIDISGYTIRGERTFTFPPRSIILPNQTITIARLRLGNTAERLIALYDTESALLYTWLPHRLRASVALATASESVVTPAPHISAVSTPTAVNEKSEAFRFAERVGTSSTVTPLILFEAPLVTKEVPLLAATVESPVAQKWPYLGLIGLLTVAILALIVRAPRNELV